MTEGIYIPKDAYEHMKERSYYNHNFYKIKPCGDWVDTYKNVVIKEDYDEFSDTYTETIGYMEDGKFVEVLSITQSESAFER